MDYNTSYRLTCAVREGNLERARELITSFGPSYTQAWAEGYGLLCEAIRNKHTQVIKLLLTNGSKVNSNTDEFTDTPLHFAVISGDIEIVKMLLDRHADVNATNWYGTTPLHYAIQHEKMEIAELLFNHGANVNAGTNEGDTPLGLAVKRGHVDAVKMLINRGANVDVEFWNGTTLLHDAIKNNKIEIAELLLNHGANVNASTNNGVTPLHLAVEKEFVDDVKMLIDRDANVNAESRNGTTPLHYAIENNTIDSAELLLNHGANVNASTNNGVTPLCLAVNNRHVKVVTMLLDRGANINSSSYKVYHALYRGINGYEPVAEILTQHIVKMKTANFYVSEQLLSVSSKYEIRYLQDICETEVAIMKNEKISNSNISLYDILIKDTNPLAKYMRNKNVVQVLRSEDYKTKYPMYASMIKSKFRKGMEKKELLEQGTKIFSFFCNFPELPHECIEQIFSYLSNNDVRSLIDTCKSVSVSNLNTDITDVTRISNTSKVLCV
ncbi:ankyrin-1-like isoform X2 [Pseudomyrmex gracilis]|uniref:ankyrin-1-like isoform X2 n=1 Tax=Pseudomyrmex gracilis TaxID=219809 RepID=UPI0009956B3E|nr:ankyrin-1-like isoform X2 [Pseudomyrmex gracilis]